jgi:hypothetical protein
MKSLHFSSQMCALATFVGTVVLAVLAAVSLLSPHATVQSADSISGVPTGVGQIIPTSLSK